MPEKRRLQEIEITKNANSLLDILCYRSKAQADKTAYIFINGVGEEVQTLTYLELYTKSLAYSNFFRKIAIKGDRVLILVSPDLNYLVSIFACQMAALIPVPLNVPSRNRSLGKLRSVYNNCGAKFALTDDRTFKHLNSRFLQDSVLNRLNIVNIDTFKLPKLSRKLLTLPDQPDIAFLQYTSGSTSEPKGVAITNQNLMANQQMICESFEHNSNSTFVGWAPLHHDQGLVGNAFQPLYLGSLCVLMAPFTFMARPLLWLETITKYQAKTSGGPSFAYELCVQRATQARLKNINLDLSSWTLAFNGADTVRPDVINDFCKIFQPFGFSSKAFFPCYGLAEASLLVSGGPKSRSPIIECYNKHSIKLNYAKRVNCDSVDARPLVACGQEMIGEKIRIIDPQTLIELPSNQIGEIWVSGKNVVRTYWGNDESSQLQLNARHNVFDNKFDKLCLVEGKANNLASQRYLRTGDLGFINRDRQLFITGRIKDLIIINGQNYYPHDLERSVQLADPVFKGRSGAVVTYQEYSKDKLLVVQEISERSSHSSRNARKIKLKQRLREKLYQEHEVMVHSIAFIRKATIPKTSSGKVQRSLVAQHYLQDKLDLW